MRLQAVWPRSVAEGQAANAPIFRRRASSLRLHIAESGTLHSPGTYLAYLAARLLLPKRVAPDVGTQEHLICQGLRMRIS
jgi:hypothetical protein